MQAKVAIREWKQEHTNHRHLGFGDGIHRCVGAPLAQLEMRIVAEEVLRRRPGLRVNDPDSLAYWSTQSRKPLTLPCGW